MSEILGLWLFTMMETLSPGRILMVFDTAIESVLPLVTSWKYGIFVGVLQDANANAAPIPKINL